MIDTNYVSFSFVEIDKQECFLRNRLQKVSLLAAMDPYRLDFYLANKHEDLQLLSTELVFLAEMSFYRKTFMLRKEDVSSSIIDFLIEKGEESLARGWTSIDYGTSDIEIDIDNIPEDVLNISKLETRALPKFNLFSKILSLFASKAKE